MLDPDESWHLPAQVYVPARLGGASGGPMLDVRELTGDSYGRLVLPVYSSMERLIACCGSDQPWMLLPADRLPELARGGGFDVVVVDVDVRRELRGSAAGEVGREPVWDDAESAEWELVYVPSRPFFPGDEQARLELQPMPGGRLALMAYSSLGTLRRGCGPHQRWVAVPAGLLDEARRQARADTIVLDTPLPQRLRHEADGRG